MTEEVTPVVEETPPTPPVISEVEQAAQKFTQLLPFVTKFGHTMSAKGLTRVMFAMSEFPLGAQKPRLINDAERQLFHVLQEINGAKSIVIQDIMKKNYEAEKLRQEAVAMAPPLEQAPENNEKQTTQE